MAPRKPRRVAARDVEQVAAQRDRVRAVEHAGPVAAGIPLRGCRLAELAEAAAEGAEVTHPIVVRIGDGLVLLHLIGGRNDGWIAHTG